MLTGVILQLPSEELAEILAHAGVDVIILDTEHSPTGYEKLVSLIRACETFGALAFVRVPSARDEAAIKRALDAGAGGIMIPNVDTAEDARRAVEYAKFPPLGRRGACPFVRANAYGGEDRTDFYAKANAETAIILLVESPEGIRNLPEIRMAQDAMADNIFRHLSFEPEDSQFIEDYYLALFTNIEEQKKSEYLFQYRDGKTYALAGLLSGNLKAGDKTYKLHQPFKTAAQEYKVFPENTYPVLVPYKEDGKKLIESMRAIDRAGRIISKTLLRQAGDYIVQVYDWQKRKLGEKSMLESLADDQIFILSEVAYDERYGLNTDAEWTMEDMIY